MSLNIIKEMKLNDTAQTAFDVSALSNMALKKISLIDTDNGYVPTENGENNLTIGLSANPDGGTYNLKNTDIKCIKSIRFYPGSKETKFLADYDTETSAKKKFNQIHIKTCVDADVAWKHGKTSPGETPSTFKDPVIRTRLGCSELELNIKNAYDRNSDGTFSQTNIDHMDITFKNDADYADGKFKARSIDVRANSTSDAVGKGGGIAIQVASCDDDRHENKFKVETSRKKDVFEGLMPSDGTYSDWYSSEGGTGVEIATINSQFESLGTKEIRRLANSDVFATTRSPIMTVYKLSENVSIPIPSGPKSTNKFGCIVTDSVSAYYADGIYDDTMKATDSGSFLSGKTYEITKYDYGTALDDSKDIKSASQANLKWVDLINAAIYLKANKSIPSDGSFIPAVNVSFVLTGVTATSAATVALKSAQYEGKFGNSSGYSLPETITVTIGGVEKTATTDYTWTPGTGVVTIPQANLTGDVVITITGTATA